jgi:hypothetical protein
MLQRVVPKGSNGRFLAGLLLGLIATPLLFGVGVRLEGPFPLLLPLAVLGIGLALKVSDEHRRTGDGLLIGYAAWLATFVVLIVWTLNTAA